MSGQRSESYLVGAVLAVAGGFLDAYTYICRGHVFANAQTGNIVLLGVNLAAGEWTSLLYYLIPILCFFVGILAAEMIRNRFFAHPAIHWRQIIVAIEIAVLFAVGFIPAGDWDLLANACVSFACSLQVQGFRKVNGNPYATTMCTGNLRSATEHLYRYYKTGDKEALHSSLQYYGIIGLFIAGAAIGTALSGWWGIYAVWAVCAVLAAVLILMIQKREEKYV